MRSRVLAPVVLAALVFVAAPAPVDAAIEDLVVIEGVPSVVEVGDTFTFQVGAETGPGPGVRAFYDIGVAPELRIDRVSAGTIGEAGCTGTSTSVRCGIFFIDDLADWQPITVDVTAVAPGLDAGVGALLSSDIFIDFFANEAVDVIEPGARLVVAELSDADCAVLDLVAAAQGVDRATAVQFGTSLLVAAAENGLASPTTPPGGERLCETDIVWPADQLDALAAAAGAWDVGDTDALTELGGEFLAQLVKALVAAAL